MTSALPTQSGSLCYGLLFVCLFMVEKKKRKGPRVSLVWSSDRTRGCVGASASLSAGLSADHLKKEAVAAPA